MCNINTKIGKPFNSLATSVNPYPIYRQLVEMGGIYYSNENKYWLISSGKYVDMVLSCNDFSVKSHNNSLNIDSPVFNNVLAHLVRFNDSTYHKTLKQIIYTELARCPLTQVKSLTQIILQQLIDKQEIDKLSISQLAYQVPVMVIASLLHLEQTYLNKIPAMIADFVMNLKMTEKTQLQQSELILSHLIDYLNYLVDHQRQGLLYQLKVSCFKQGITDPIAYIANSIGLMSQTFDATAGLIGNTILQLSTRYTLVQKALKDDTLWLRICQESCRYDSPVQNTRRYAKKAIKLAHHNIQENDMVILLLAAANRDPAMNPDQFIANRPNRKLFSYGKGTHQCPGTQLSLTITTTFIQVLLQNRVNIQHLAYKPVDYYPSINNRIPKI